MPSVHYPFDRSTRRTCPSYHRGRHEDQTVMSTDPRVDAYIAKSAPFARPILTYIRKAVHTGCPDVEETMKWSFPHFVYKGVLCSMASFKAHCAFGFWKASLLEGVGSAGKSAEVRRVIFASSLMW